MHFATYHSQDRIGYVTLNRPEKRNALNAVFITELKEAFLAAENDNACKVIILQAKGDAFCAGADLEYMESLRTNTFEENFKDSSHLMELLQQIYLCSKIVIASVNGHAIAGGCGLASVCDFSFSTDKALFGYTEVKLGFIPALVSVFLLRKIGEARTKELLLTGDLINAGEAQRIGLINYVVEASDLVEKVFIFASNLCKNASGNSLSQTKRLITDIQNLDLNSSLELAARKNAEIRNSDDFRKGIQSFLNKDKLSW